MAELAFDFLRDETLSAPTIGKGDWTRERRGCVFLYLYGQWRWGFDESDESECEAAAPGQGPMVAGASPAPPLAGVVAGRLARQGPGEEVWFASPQPGRSRVVLGPT